MAEQFTSFIVANDEAFRDLLDKVSKNVSDFRIPFGLIAKDFYRSNRKLFTLKSPGLYPDYGGFNPNAPDRFQGEFLTRRDAARLRKKRQVGFVYPMMVRDGGLAASLLGPRNAGAVFEKTKTSLVLGTDIKYAIYHQSDRPRKKLPQRKVVFIDGGPAEKARDAAIAGRSERWFNIVVDYERQVLTGSATL